MNKELLEKQMVDVKKEILSDFQKELDEELSKPAKKRDYDRITELSELIYENCIGKNETVSESKEKFKGEFLQQLNVTTKPSRTKLYNRLSIVALWLLIIVGLNTASLKVFGQNMFSAVYQISKGGITINANQTDEVSDISTSDSDPYGMKAKCAEYGFFPDTPDYIPEGFELVDIYEKRNEGCEIIAFYYKKDKIILNFFFTNYKDNAEIPPIGFPTDTYNVSEEQINEHTIYILKEDKQFSAFYIDKRIEYGVFAEGLNYNECQKVLSSLS